MHEVETSFGKKNLKICLWQKIIKIYTIAIKWSIFLYDPDFRSNEK